MQNMESMKTFMRLIHWILREAVFHVLEWATLHRNELRDDWERARMEKPLVEIEGLE